MPGSFSFLRRLCAAIACLSLQLIPLVHAEAQNLAFEARLAPLPVDFRSVSKITGLGQIKAELNGSFLLLRGNFAGLTDAATAAHLHRGPAGIPGPAIAELQVTTAAEGEVLGRIQLNPEQIEALHQRALYVQIHSHAAPEGNLRGWLFPISK